jgi:serine/threonine protein kinase
MKKRQGKKGIVSLYNDPVFGIVAVKRYKQGTEYEDSMHARILKETKILLELKKLHKAGIYPGEIFVLKTNVKENMDWRKAYIMMKYYETTLLEFMQKFHAKWIYKSIIFQIMVQLLVIHKYLGINHRDLHSENILITRTQRKSIVYKINGVIHEVSTYGYLVAIIDFDRSREFDEKYDDLAKMHTLWYNIIYALIKKGIRTNKILQSQMQTQAFRDSKEHDPKLWSWYIKTGGIDRNLFKFLLASGFDWTTIISDKYVSFINYIIKILYYDDLNSFGYSIKLQPSKIDYVINTLT